MPSTEYRVQAYRMGQVGYCPIPTFYLHAFSEAHALSEVEDILQADAKLPIFNYTDGVYSLGRGTVGFQVQIHEV